MTTSPDCSLCGGEVTEKDRLDYRRASRLLLINNVPAGECSQCEEKYFKHEILKKIDDPYQEISTRTRSPSAR
jgi:YgiT-type zinc finger domain-containing protein